MAVFFMFSMLLGVCLQITNSYGTMFIDSFQNIAEYAQTWGGHIEEIECNAINHA